MRTVAWMCGVLALGWVPLLDAARLVVIGDSLSAEYESVPDFPGVENPTAYAAVTVPGWESMSWVEVLGRLRGADFDLGDYRASLIGWGDLRFSGYEYNFAIPGYTAAQFEDIVNSSILSNPHYLLYRRTLEDALEGGLTRVVIWLGANEFRGNYGMLYDGSDPNRLVSNLSQDLGEVLDFVRALNPQLEVMLVNLPDLGAAPDKQQAHPDPIQRAQVTEATQQANVALAALAVSQGATVADVFLETRRLIEGEPIRFGAVDILPGTHPDNHPRYAFTRDGLHPNTPLQIQIARIILERFNTAYDAGIPQITDAEALELMGLDPNLPYWDWIGTTAVADNAMDADPDRDRLVNLVEYAFGLDPAQADSPPVALETQAGRLELSYRPDPSRSRHVAVVPEYSDDLRHWDALPPERVTIQVDGIHHVEIPVEGPHGFCRILISLLEP